MFRATLIALVAALTVAAPAAGELAEQASPAAAAFNDAAGDSGAAPDVTDVALGNDVVAGPVVFWVSLGNRPADLAGEDVVFLLLDADRNPATGDESGAEYAIGVDAEAVWVMRWDGADYVDLEAPSVRATFVKAVKALRVSIHPSELGGLASFDFFVATFNGEAYDSAPNGPPAWSYTLATGRPQLLVLGFALSPKAPVAGKALTVGLGVGRGDTLDVLGEGKVTCTLVVGGKRLKAARAALVQGVAVCRWNLPRAAKGKLLKGSVAVAFGGSTAKKSFTARAR